MGSGPSYLVWVCPNCLHVRNFKKKDGKSNVYYCSVCKLEVYYCNGSIKIKPTIRRV